jgi:hypothetical protein
VSVLEVITMFLYDVVLIAHCCWLQRLVVKVHAASLQHIKYYGVTLGDNNPHSMIIIDLNLKNLRHNVFILEHTGYLLIIIKSHPFLR